MSSLYEQWQPSVGDRVRVVMRDETGAAIKSGRTGTIVGVQPGTPQALCEVEYDSRPDSGPTQGRQTLAASELEPIEEPAIRAVPSERERSAPTAGAGPAWQPTVGDRVAIAAGNLAGTITAVDKRGDDTVCEVQYDHRPGEPAQTQWGSYSVRDLTPLREPSAAVLEDDDRPPQEPVGTPGPT
jgi:hypothetical protein